MANLELDENQSPFQIRSYQPGKLQVNDQFFTHSVIVTPTQLITDWLPQTISELSPETLAFATDLKPDILLIGTGAKLILLPIELYGELLNHGIGVEIMDTGAACRTFNALTAENRNVAAALLIS